MKKRLKNPNPNSQKNSPLACALQSLIAGKDTAKDRDIIADTLCPLAKLAIRDTRANNHHDREDLTQDVLAQMIPKGIINDKTLCDLARSAAPDERLLARLKTQFYMRVYCRAIDLIRHQKIRWAPPLDEAAIRRIEVSPSTFPKTDEVLEEIENSLLFNATEKTILKQCLASGKTLKKSAAGLGISREKARRLLRRAKQFLHAKFGIVPHKPRSR